MSETLICPITYQLMLDPVVTDDGYTYEREAIETHMEKAKKQTSPITREKITKLFPNRLVRNRIKKLLARNPELKKHQYENQKQQSHQDIIRAIHRNEPITQKFSMSIVTDSDTLELLVKNIDQYLPWIQNVNVATSFGHTLMIRAVVQENLEAIKKLMNRGAQNKRSGGLFSPLEQALITNQREIAEYIIISYGYNLHNDGGDIVSYCLNNNRQNSLDLIMDLTNARISTTTIMKAIELHFNKNIIQKMLKKVRDRDSNILHAICKTDSYSENEMIEMISLFEEQGYDIGSANKVLESRILCDDKQKVREYLMSRKTKNDSYTIPRHVQSLLLD